MTDAPVLAWNYLRCPDNQTQLDMDGVMVGVSREALAETLDEIERLNKALKYEENRSGRMGTHGPGCHLWGPSHYECLVREYEELRKSND